MRHCLVTGLLLAVVVGSAPAREFVPEKVLAGRFGKSEVQLSQSLSDFKEIGTDAVIHVTVDLPANPDEFLAAESFYKSFSRMYPNAKFTPSQDGIAVGDYTAFVSIVKVSDSYESTVPEYRTESTGVDCKRRSGGNVSCTGTGQRRVLAGNRTVTSSASIVGINVAIYSVVDSDGSLVSLRSGDATLSLTGDDNCRNMRNVFASLGYALGSRPLSNRPVKDIYRAYPNQFGCYDNDDIILK